MIVVSPNREHVTKKELKMPPVISLKNCKNNNGSIKILILSPTIKYFKISVFTFFDEDFFWKKVVFIRLMVSDCMYSNARTKICHINSIWYII